MRPCDGMMYFYTRKKPFSLIHCEDKTKGLYKKTRVAISGDWDFSRKPTDQNVYPIRRKARTTRKKVEGGLISLLYLTLSSNFSNRWLISFLLTNK